MDTVNHETARETGRGQCVVTAPPSGFTEAPPVDEDLTLLAPTCLEREEMHRIAEMDTPNSQFYVGRRGICLVEAVDMTESPKIDLDGVLERVERKLIKFALEKTNGARAGAARLMGISRSRLYRRLHAFGLDCRDSHCDVGGSSSC